MFNFKKFAALLCSVAISATTFIVPVSAATVAGQTNIKATLSSGYTDFDASRGRTYITLNLEGLDDLDGEFTTGGNVKIRMTKGIFKSAAKSSLEDEGLYNFEDDSEPSFEVNFSSSNADYDQVTVLWSGNDAPLETETGAVVEIRLVYADTAALGDAYFTLVNSSDDSSVQIDLVDGNGNLTGERMLLADNDTEYKLASGTNVITEVADDDDDNDDEPTTATVVGDTHVGDKETEGDEADTTDKAVAIFGTPVAPAAHSTSLVWTVTNTSDVTKTFTQAVDVEGGATYNFGLVLRNITADLIKTVSAAFAQ